MCSSSYILISYNPYLILIICMEDILIKLSFGCNGVSFLTAKKIFKLPHSSVKQPEAEAWVLPQDKMTKHFLYEDLPMAST